LIEKEHKIAECVGNIGINTAKAVADDPIAEVVLATRR
jgi:hypothetical protein